MEVKMNRTKAHIHERIAQLVNGADTVRRSQRVDDANLDEIRFCVADKVREMQWR